MNSPDDPAPRAVATPAAPGWRLLALAYDLLPAIALLMVTSALFLAINGGDTVERDPLVGFFAFASMWAVLGCYFVFSWRRGGQTVGMRPWRLKVIAADGRPAAVRALWLRYLVAWLTPGLGLLWSFVDPQRRALYDIASSTLLVRLEAGAKP